MYFLIHKEMSLPVNTMEINVFILADSVKEEIWRHNPQVSLVYKKMDTNQIFLYIPRRGLKEKLTLYGYTRIQVSETPIN